MGYITAYTGVDDDDNDKLYWEYDDVYRNTVCTIRRSEIGLECVLYYYIAIEELA